MNNYSSVESVPAQFTMTNPLQSSNQPKKDSSCQPSFTYFPTHTDPQVYWGSEKPRKEQCSPKFKPHQGTPNHAIWNNSTKRKTIVTKF